MSIRRKAADDLGRPLSATQARVTECLVVGATVDETARDLGISPNTVRTHIKTIYRKLGIASRVELVRAMLIDGPASHGGPS